MAMKKLCLEGIVMKKFFFVPLLLVLPLFSAQNYLTSQKDLTAQKAGGRFASVPVIAEYETTELRTLSDGNVLERKESGLYYRDRHGRTRREQGTLIAITDPVAGVGFVLDTKSKIARKLVLPKANLEPATNVSRADQSSPEQKADLEPATNIATNVVRGGQLSRERASLGIQVIEGVKAAGKEYVAVIPAGSKLGNNQPIEQTIEVWTSDEVRLPILTIVKDPLSGQKTQRYKNIQRGVHPDPKLFQVPEDYQIVEVNPVRR